MHGYLSVAHLGQLHALGLDPLTGRGQLRAVRQDERTRVGSGPGELAGNGVALFDDHIYGQGAVREGGLVAAPLVADGRTALGGTVRRYQDPILGIGVDEALQVPSVVQLDGPFVRIFAAAHGQSPLLRRASHPTKGHHAPRLHRAAVSAPRAEANVLTRIRGNSAATGTRGLSHGTV